MERGNSFKRIPLRSVFYFSDLNQIQPFEREFNDEKMSSDFINRNPCLGYLDTGGLNRRFPGYPYLPGGIGNADHLRVMQICRCGIKRAL
jgi:hypothetical protein